MYSVVLCKPSTCKYRPICSKRHCGTIRLFESVPINTGLLLDGSCHPLSRSTRHPGHRKLIHQPIRSFKQKSIGFDLIRRLTLASPRRKVPTSKYQSSLYSTSAADRPVAVSRRRCENPVRFPPRSSSRDFKILFPVIVVAQRGTISFPHRWLHLATGARYD